MYTKYMKYWLMKSEPNEFSIDDLQRTKSAQWDGVRNYQVRNMLRDEMRKGDLALFYHSNAGKETGVVGIMEITSDSYTDPTQFDISSQYFDPNSTQHKPRWLSINVTFQKKFSTPLLLRQLKNITIMSSSPVIRKGNRLSIIPLTEEQYLQILVLTARLTEVY